MASASKKKKKIRLKSKGLNQHGKPTGYFKTTTNSSAEKLKLRKYDPRAYNPKTKKHGMYVEFVQDKIK